jgi:hypothetical protein
MPLKRIARFHEFGKRSLQGANVLPPIAVALFASGFVISYESRSHNHEKHKHRGACPLTLGCRDE